MVIFRRTADLQNYLQSAPGKGFRLGFVPTMGALHSGHISLIQRARHDKMTAICSIFLNPTQFNDKTDLEKYPVTVDHDIDLLVNAGCDILFLPTREEVYPDGPESMPTYDFGYLDTILEGAKRPGHFKGVGQVVARMLNIVKPTKLYLGQKDYQQCMVIKKLAQLMHLDDLEVVFCPTLREADGLAMSSRNTRLTEAQRTLSGLLYQCLISIQTKQDGGNFAIVQKECIDLLVRKGLRPEYVVLANAKDLTLLENYDASIPMVALIAAFIGEVRLIDNILLNP